MERLFEPIQGGKSVSIRAEILSLDGFAKLWESDTTPNKKEAYKKFSYIYFICSRAGDNPYSDIADKDERMKIVKQDLWGKNSKYSPLEDKLIVGAIKEYMERNPKNEYDEQADFLYEQIRRDREFLRGTPPDTKKSVESGELLLKPAERHKAYEAINKAVKELEEMKTLAAEKRKRDVQIRGGGEEG